MHISLEGKRALVTGGNSGIGAAIAAELAKAGAKVAINYVTDQDTAEKLAAEIRARGRDTITIQADVSHSREVEAMFKQLDERWGGIDILINNAGIDGIHANTWEIDIDDWEKVLNINLGGNFYCARQALRRMVAQNYGVILATSSVHETIAWSGHSAYTTSKAALGMLTKTMAQEAAPYNVRVLALAPGAIKTSINKDVWDNPKGYKDLLEKIPLNRIGDPEEVARMAVVLVSDTASYVTGRTIYVDGGMTDYPDFAHGG